MYYNPEVALRMSAQNLFGTRGVSIVAEGDDLDAVLKCQYPEGSVEAELEARADALLAKYNISADISAKIEADIEASIATGKFDFGEEIFAPAMSGAEICRMTERFEGARSVEELADLLVEYGKSPEAQTLCMACVKNKGWNTRTHMDMFRSRMVAV